MEQHRKCSRRHVPSCDHSRHPALWQLSGGLGSNPLAEPRLAVGTVRSETAGAGHQDHTSRSAPALLVSQRILHRKNRSDQQREAMRLSTKWSGGWNCLVLRVGGVGYAAKLRENLNYAVQMRQARAEAINKLVQHKFAFDHLFAIVADFVRHPI